MRPTALAAGPLVPTVDSQRPLAPCHDASTGTKLSRHAPPAGDTGTKLSQHAAPSAHPVQNSPSTPENADFGPLSARRENLFTLTPITSHAGRALYRTRGLCRYKTLPTHAPGGRYRYKTLPARPKTPILGHFAPAGRTLYRFHHHQAEQGEFSTANGTTYGTKLSQHAAPAAHPVQNSPDTQPSRPHPVQNSPDTPQNADFGPLSARRESFIPLPPPPSRAGRKKSRTGRAKRGGASPYNPRNALIAGISRTAWTRPAR